MMNKVKRSEVCGLVYLAILIVFITGTSPEAYSQAERKFIREGNRFYNKEQFDESELSYRRALEKDEVSPQARFNLGNSLYKQDRFDEAARYFEELAGEIDDPVNRSRIYHNMGNSLLMSQQIEQSIEAYKEALRNNPGDQETRYNLAFAQNLLDESDEDQQEGDDSQEGEDQDGDDGNQNKDQQDQESEQDQDQDQGDGNQSPEQEQEQQSRTDQISQEEALRMLEAAERDDQRVQEKLNEQKKSERQPVTGRNW